MGKLVFSLTLMAVILGIQVDVLGQSNKKDSRKTVNIDVILVPSPPAGPIPIPYPNLRVKYQTSLPQNSIFRGKSIAFELSGDNLENIGSAEVYLSNSQKNAFEVKLQPISKGAKRIQHRKLMITPKSLSNESTVYKINFRKDRKSPILYTREFHSKSSRIFWQNKI